MTTSRQPWSTRFSKEKGNEIIDATGVTIGIFNDWRLAQFCVDAVNDYDTDWRNEKEILEHTIVDLQRELNEAQGG